MCCRYFNRYINEYVYIHSDNSIPVKLYYNDYEMTGRLSLYNILHNISVEKLCALLPNVIILKDSIHLRTYDHFITIKTNKYFYDKYLSNVYNSN